MAVFDLNLSRRSSIRRHTSNQKTTLAPRPAPPHLLPSRGRHRRGRRPDLGVQQRARAAAARARARRSDGVAVRAPIFGTRLAAVTSEWFLSGFGYRSSCATLPSWQARVPELIFGTLLTGSNDDDERGIIAFSVSAGRRWDHDISA